MLHHYMQVFIYAYKKNNTTTHTNTQYLLTLCSDGDLISFSPVCSCLNYLSVFRHHHLFTIQTHTDSKKKIPKSLSCKVTWQRYDVLPNQPIEAGADNSIIVRNFYLRKRYGIIESV